MEQLVSKWAPIKGERVNKAQVNAMNAHMTLLARCLELRPEKVRQLDHHKLDQNIGSVLEVLAPDTWPDDVQQGLVNRRAEALFSSTVTYDRSFLQALLYRARAAVSLQCPR